MISLTCDRDGVITSYRIGCILPSQEPWQPSTWFIEARDSQGERIGYTEFMALRDEPDTTKALAFALTYLYHDQS